MRVLLTGHLGFIGAVMGPMLSRAGHDVVGVDTGYFADCTFGERDGGFAERRADIRDLQADDLEGFDAVVHLAALSNDPVGDLEPQQTYDINHHASVRLAEAAKAAGVRRFLYASSCSVYGKAGTDAPLDETAPFAPASPYAESKVAVEADVAPLADEAFCPVFLRNATAYGWSPQLRTDIVLNDLVASAVLTGEVLVKSDGTPWRPIVHVEDICRAFLAALEAPAEAVCGQALNVGRDEENYQVADIAALVADAVPDATVVITGEAGPDPRSYRVDFGKIGEVLPSFQPVWTAADGARQLVKEYRRVGLDQRTYAERSKRLPVLKAHLAAGRLDGSLRWCG